MARDHRKRHKVTRAQEALFAIILLVIFTMMSSWFTHNFIFGGRADIAIPAICAK